MTSILEKLMGYFLKFPGIGPRQARRFAYFLSGQDEEFLKELSNFILEIKKNVRQCRDCFRFFESSKSVFKCDICSSLNRDKSLLLVVEKDVDLENIEKSGVYGGRYFILGGIISLTNNKQSELRFKELFEKVKKNSPAGEPREVILALSATIEGDNTSRYVEKILEPLKIKITRLGRGLSTGTELEYSDTQTISDALESRK